MSPIIRAADVQAGRVDRTSSVFNFEDMAERAEEYLAQVRNRAQQEGNRIAQELVAAAKQEANAVRATAERQGRERAMATIDQLVERKVAERLDSLLPAMEEAIVAIRHARQEWMTHGEKTTVGLARAIAERILRRELSDDVQLPLALVQESLELAAGSGQIRLRLNPVDRKNLGDAVQQVVNRIAQLGDTEVLPDEGVARGGCVVETQFGRIDQQIESQLARIEEELTR